MSQKQSNSNEWTVYRGAGYAVGIGLHYGGGEGKYFAPRAQHKDKYCLVVDPRRGPEIDVSSDNFSIFKNNTFNWILLDNMWKDHSDPLTLLKQARAKIQDNGHLLFRTQSQDSKINPLDLLEKSGGWIQKDFQTREGLTFGVFKKHFKKGIHINPVTTKPRACIARYGAFGDQIQVTPLVRHLYEDGYDVTINTQTNSMMIYKHNPFISNVVGQERDFIFNPELGHYWKEWESEYDKYINLSESIEGTLLKVEGRRDYYTTKEFREGTCDKNYWDFIVELGGYTPNPNGTRGEMYFSNKEEEQMRKFMNNLRPNKVVLWAMKGSSHHKVYPFTSHVIEKFLGKPVVFVLVGGKEEAIITFNHPNMINMVGKWNIRESMLATKYADVVIGPETGVLNAASCFDTPKIIFLSHSTEENLTKHWANTKVFKPNTTCYPCHQMHYTLESCPLATITDESGKKQLGIVPLCSVEVASIEEVTESISQIVL